MSQTTPSLVLGAALALAYSPPAMALDWKPSLDQVPAEYSGPIFKPNFDFASTKDDGSAPWQQLDFRSLPNSYLDTILNYIFEGVAPSSGDLAKSTRRNWFHVPLMEHGPSGREFTHGLTRERDSRIGELGPLQRRCTQAWAIGMYNPAGAITLGAVFGDGSTTPDAAKATFPVGTVVAKFLYTEATPEELPFLQGAPSLIANISRRTVDNPTSCPPSDGSVPRVLTQLRLLQLDVAVRDARADITTGWVFGTFVYDSEISNPDPWKRLRPVGLMWGNDPNLTDSQAARGVKPTESFVNPIPHFSRVFGRGGRMNGPVDNQASACLSCHMTAQFPQVSGIGLAPPLDAPWSFAACWFRNLGPTVPFGKPQDGNCDAKPVKPSVSLDFSLQLALALRNYMVLSTNPVSVQLPADNNLSVSDKGVNPGGSPLIEPFIHEGQIIGVIGRSGYTDP
jgi:hypothetical protein